MIDRRLAAILLLFGSCAAAAKTTPPKGDEPNLLCGGCQMAVKLIESRLNSFENLTKNDLTRFAKTICANAPQSEIFKTLCTSVRDDIIDVAIQIIEAIERQIGAEHTCKMIHVC
ncbi:unnamed protein product [Caenorhabditis bovis]|uniref:Saposin B-type domain-containing protein n=1 Tax=Caenorhabditis bovis TaxID=2654633 RepID=A0A8S1E832_9PELO|nr:unnamed protein product [Caenorhabditis bovis]